MAGKLGVGLIGSGFMGRAHALAFRSVGTVFELELRPELELIADVDEAAAQTAADALGFNRATGDWQALIADPAVDLIAITAPTHLHREMVLAAIAANKSVYCEKPLAGTLEHAREMTAAAEAAGIATLVGFNYLKNPIAQVAREIIADGEIGEVVSMRGIHAEDYMADPDAPITWRHDPVGGGVIADLGSHIVSLARYLLGDIAEVSATLRTLHGSRPVAPGAAERRTVTTDDEAHMLVRFAGGTEGTLSASWVATGRKMQLAFEITGTRGSLAFTQERFNELKLYRAGQTPGRDGFTTITAGPDHPDYAPFCPAPGHQLGFNDMKVIEVKALLQALADGTAPEPGFAEATEIQRVVEAARMSAGEGRWVTLSEV